MVDAMTIKSAEVLMFNKLLAGFGYREMRWFIFNSLTLAPKQLFTITEKFEILVTVDDIIAIVTEGTAVIVVVIPSGLSKYNPAGVTAIVFAGAQYDPMVESIFVIDKGPSVTLDVSIE